MDGLNIKCTWHATDQAKRRFPSLAKLSDEQVKSTLLSIANKGEVLGAANSRSNDLMVAQPLNRSGEVVVVVLSRKNLGDGLAHIKTVLTKRQAMKAMTHAQNCKTRASPKLKRRRYNDSDDQEPQTQQEIRS